MIEKEPLLKYVFAHQLLAVSKRSACSKTWSSGSFIEKYKYLHMKYFRVKKVNRDQRHDRVGTLLKNKIPTHQLLGRGQFIVSFINVLI